MGDVRSPQDRLWGRGWLATERGLYKVPRPCAVYTALRSPSASRWRTVGKVQPLQSQGPQMLCSQPLTHGCSHSVNDCNPIVTHLQVLGARAVDWLGLACGSWRCLGVVLSSLPGGLALALGPPRCPDPYLFPCRWLEVQVAHLTCPQRWVQYLRLLQESIWPGGALPKCPRPVRTPEQKAAAEKQALQSLMGVLPGDCRETDGAIAFLPTPLSCHYPTPFSCFQRALSAAGLSKCVDLLFLRPTGK